MINKLNECLDENKEFSQLVDLINNSIENDNKNIFVLEKLLIILMVTKLEVFLEKSTSQWFDTLKKEPIYTAYNLSETIKREVIKDTINSIYDELKNGTISNRNKNKINNFNILLDDFYPLNKLDIEFKITLNSHGSSEIKSLLKKIGISDIFELMEEKLACRENDEFLGDINLTTQVDYESNINKLINYRNKIIHEDDNVNMSYFDINEFVESLNLLSNIVKDYVQNFCIDNNVEQINS